MTIDPLLLTRLRDQGMPDARIRHLHDAIERGSENRRHAAIHLMSEVAGGPVRHYTREDGVTAELALGDGLHWTGRALRISARRPLPATLMATLPGRRLSSVADFPGADRHVITGTSMDSNGNAWIAADAAKDEPPARGGLLQRACYRFALRRDDRRRNGTRMVCHGGEAAAVVAGIVIAIFIMPVWAVMFAHPLIGALMGMGLLALAALIFTLPWPEDWEDARKTHMTDMARLQAAQGW